MAVNQRRLREFQRREHDILGAALELFAGERWESVSVEQIAERAQIGKGTVYKHFASKDEIYARLALDFFGGLLESCRDLPQHDDPAQELRAAFRSALEYHLRNQTYRNVRQYVYRAGFWERLERRYVEEFERLDIEFAQWAGRLLQRGMDEGVFQRQDITALRIGLDALFTGAVDHLWGGRCWLHVETEDYIGHVVDFALKALGIDPQRRASSSAEEPADGAAA